MRSILCRPGHALLWATAFLLMVQASCRGTSTGFQHQARAEVIESAEQLIGGPAAEGRPGDILIHNAWIRAIIQVPHDQNAPEAVFGGSLIDLDIARRPLEQGQDHLRAMVPWFGPGHGARPDTVRIADDGSATGQAIVEVIAHDVQLRTIEQALRRAGLSLAALPGDPSARIAVDIRTRYILGSHDRAILVETTLINQGNDAIQLPVGDFIAMRPDMAQFVVAGAGQSSGRPSPGFGPWDERIYNQTSMIGWTGAAISYIWLPFGASPYEQKAATSCALPMPHQVLCAAGATFASGTFSPVAEAWGGAADGNASWLNIPPRGTGAGVWRRYIGVAEDGIGAALSGIMADKEFVETALTVVDVDGTPVSGAEVAIASNVDGVWYPWLHGWSDAQGVARFPLHKGLWRALAWKRGYSVSAPTGPDQQDFSISAAGVDPVSFSLTVGAPGTVELFTQNQARTPIPARIYILGMAPVAEITASSTTATTTLRPFLPGPETTIPEVAKANLIALSAAAASALPDPVRVVAVLNTDASGAGRIQLPAGRYVAAGWRGADYDVTATVVDVSEGDTVRALLTLPQIAPRTDHLWAEPLRATVEGDATLERSDVGPWAAAAGARFVGVVDQRVVAPLVHGSSTVTSISGVRIAAPDRGDLALFSLTALPLPLRSKPVPAAGEMVTPAVARGGAPAQIDPDTGEWNTAVDQLGAAVTRATEPRATWLIDPSTTLDDLALSLDPTAGEDGVLIGENAALWPSSWTALLSRPRQHGLTGLWRDVNVGFAFWNIGHPAVVLASSAADADDWTPPALASASRVVISADAAATAVVAAIADGRASIGNQVSLDLRVEAALWNLAGTATVLDAFGPVSPGDLLVIRRDNFPKSGTDYALDITATITVRAPVWARLSHIELFDTARYVTAATVDLSTVTAAAWTITDTDWAASTTSESLVVDNATTMSGRFVLLTRTYTTRITAGTLLAVDTPDRWFAARAWGEGDIFPVALDVDGQALPAFAFVNPVYVDLGGEAGLPFDDAWDAPCEVAASSSCPD